MEDCRWYYSPSRLALRQRGWQPDPSRSTEEHARSKFASVIDPSAAPSSQGDSRRGSNRRPIPRLSASVADEPHTETPQHSTNRACVRSNAPMPSFSLDRKEGAVAPGMKPSTRRKQLAHRQRHRLAFVFWPRAMLQLGCLSACISLVRPRAGARSIADRKRLPSQPSAALTNACPPRLNPHPKGPILHRLSPFTAPGRGV